MRTRTVALSAALFLAAAGGCVPKPKQAYSDDQLKQLESLEELMRVQADAADPQFNKIGQATYSDADYAGLLAAAQKLQATSESLRTRFTQGRGPSFATFATRMGEQAGELSSAVGAKDPAKISAALTGIREACRACHKEHK